MRTSLLLSFPVLALSAPLASDLGADLTAPVAPALSDALDAQLTADAAIIRKGLIRKSTGGSYATVWQIDDPTPNDPSDDAAELDVSFSGGDGGSPPARTINQGADPTARFAAELPPPSGPYTVEVEMTDGTVFVAVGGGPERDGEPVTTPLPQGHRLHERVIGLAYNDVDNRLYRVSHSGNGWDASSVAEVRVREGAVVHPVPFEAVETTWTKNLPSGQLPAGFGVGSSFVATATAVGGDGATLDFTTTTGFVVDSDEEPTGATYMDEATLGLLDDGTLELTTTVFRDPAAPTTLLDASIVDDAGTLLLDTAGTAPSATAQLFTVRTLEFEDPDAAVGVDYDLSIGFLDDAGGLLGYAELNLIAEGLSVDSPGGAELSVPVGAEDVPALVAIARIDATSFALNVAVGSGAVSAVEVGIYGGDQSPPTIPDWIIEEPVWVWDGFQVPGTGGAGTLDGGGTAVVDQSLQAVDGTTLGVAADQVDSPSETVFAKKRPGAPKGQVRSARVRSTLGF